MTREDFLSKKWTPYPQPNHQMYEDTQWLWGKIEKSETHQIRLSGQSPSLTVPPQTVPHPILGENASPAILKAGDAVAYNQQTNACYLLSPSLVESPVQNGTLLQNTAAQNQVDWQLFVETVRQYFTKKGFTHWQTPTLLESSGIDAHIDFFSATGTRTQRRYYLPTSPEFALKKAMADGQTKIFEIKSAFRDDDKSKTHEPEFTMIEWYRAYANKWQLLKDFEDLIKEITEKLNLPTRPPATIKKTSIAEVFEKQIQHKLTPTTTKQELKKILQQKQMDTSPSDDWDDLFFRLYIEFIEPNLGKDDPEAIYNFPQSQGSLSRQTEEGWSDRFEIYWQGIELANAYQEQNNPKAIEERYKSEIQKRITLGREPHPLDEEFLQKMHQGFPPSAGIAMGLDRLWMVLTRSKQIQRSFPL